VCQNYLHCSKLWKECSHKIMGRYETYANSFLAVFIGADFAGATGASAPAQFLQRGLSPLTYDAARNGRGGREGGEGRGGGGEGHSAPAHLKASRRLWRCSQKIGNIRRRITVLATRQWSHFCPLTAEDIWGEEFYFANVRSTHCPTLTESPCHRCDCEMNTFCTMSTQGLCSGRSQPAFSRVQHNNNNV
jgi:hypothetical protein